MHTCCSSVFQRDPNGDRFIDGVVDAMTLSRALQSLFCGTWLLRRLILVLTSLAFFNRLAPGISWLRERQENADFRDFIAMWLAPDFTSQFRPARGLVLETKTRVSGSSGGAANRLLGSSRYLILSIISYVCTYRGQIQMVGRYPPPRARLKRVRRETPCLYE